MNNHQTEKTKEDFELEAFVKFQEDCDHQGHFLPMNQLQVPDGVTRKLVLINTIICSLCGKQFQQSIVTGISIGNIVQPNFVKQ